MRPSLTAACGTKTIDFESSVASDRSLFATGRPFGSGVRADGHPAADRELFERGGGEPVTAPGWHDTIVDDLHARQRRRREVDADGHPKRGGEFAGRFEHVLESLPSLSRVERCWVERRCVLGGRVTDAVEDEPRNLAGEVLIEWRTLVRPPQPDCGVAEESRGVVGAGERTADGGTGPLGSWRRPRPGSPSR